ncbi:MAG: HAMP domain-containing protein [Stigonema ocellatum SAG 48.90 = DSM 106950]|nr:HAMP domain-containing protein [Stigonema ocellatum SAG 48.90 = DSM 106950]
MATSIDDHEQTYQQAYKAYVQRNYEVAATLINQAVLSLPNDPNTHLLRGHVYYVLQQYDVAKEEYQKVLELTKDPEIIGFAHNGLENISQYQQQLDVPVAEVDDHAPINFSEVSETLALGKEELKLGGNDDFNDKSLENHSLEEIEEIEEIKELPSSSPFDIPPTESIIFDSTSNSSGNSAEDPFSLNQIATISSEEQVELELPAIFQEEIAQATLEEPQENSYLEASNANFANQNSESPQNNSGDSPFTPVELPSSKQEENQASLSEESFLEQSYENSIFQINSLEHETLPAGETPVTASSSSPKNRLQEEESTRASMLEFIEIPSAASKQNFQESSTSLRNDLDLQEKQIPSNSRTDQSHNHGDDGFDVEAFESAFGSEELTVSGDTSNILSRNTNQSNNIEFLDDFDEFDDLGNIPGFEITSDSSFGDSQLHSRSSDTNGDPVSESIGHRSTSNASRSAHLSDRDAELFSITGSQEAVPVFTQTDLSKIEPSVNIEQGLLAPLENAPLANKQWLIAGTVGIVSALVVAVVSFVGANFSPPQQRESVRNTGWAMTLAAGIAGFATAGLMANVTLRQIRRTTKELQAQFDAVRQGNLNVQATVYSEDEFGQLAAGFNEMARVIFTTTSEATRKAQEQEEAKENLQRQVIRLLDDVEGAARGDLTVQAEVTADVLGAVADAFNLTIQNLRDIVQQVKVAAREVTKGSTNSETFARALSSDALRQAEELAVTLSSVQVMTDSIQRVAEAAREAEAVARDASEIALKGGDAVENTVAGILEIRETVAETTRKVKRLAESSQEISKIVALISQIASRTNLLALNASIEAARAGEAGRGFAIVADEVRQLADKSAKSLKEIEQIVMQIQSETGSVMTAMEEGTQQVIQGTKLAEEAKRSLENIIQVAKRIDILVRSITTDTVEQTETSRAVAQVMQSVELTAQETSQEAQRVSGALQNLVGVSRDLIASVERFRVETAESR